MNKISWKKLKEENLKSKVFLLPTDTVYGFHCLVNDDEALLKLRNLKDRGNNNFIILIYSISDIEDMGVVLSDACKKFLKKNWPGKISCIFRLGDKTFSFRMPQKRALRDFIKKVGPIYSTSANKHGKDVVSSPDELEKGLSSEIDFFIDEGVLIGQPSLIVEFLRM